MEKRIGFENSAKAKLSKRSVRIQNRSAHTLSRMDNDRVTGQIRGDTRVAALAATMEFPSEEDLGDMGVSQLTSALRMAKMMANREPALWGGRAATIGRILAIKLQGV